MAKNNPMSLIFVIFEHICNFLLASTATLVPNYTILKICKFKTENHNFSQSLSLNASFCMNHFEFHTWQKLQSWGSISEYLLFDDTILCHFDTIPAYARQTVSVRHNFDPWTSQP